MPDSPTREMMKEEEKHLQAALTAEAENPTEEGTGEAMGHANLQVRRAVTIGQFVEILGAALRNLDLDALLPDILGRIRGMLEADEVTVYLPDPKGGELFAQASVGFERAIQDRIRVPVGEGVAGAVFNSHVSQTLYDVNEKTVANPLLVEMGIRSLAAAPIMLGSAAIGVLTVGCRSGRRFDAQEVQLLEVVGARLALAIERTQILGLVQSERGRAERASRFKTTLLHMASHDIKTPLTVMKLQLRMLAMPGMTPEAQAQARAVVDRNVNRMELMLNDFLDMARVEAGKFTLQLVQVNLAALADEVVQMYQPHAAQKKLGLRLEGEPVFMDGDERRLTQVLVNLVSNAIRYTDQGLVVVRVGRKDTRPPVASIMVKDTGRGLSAQQLALLFQPFGQVTQGVQEGTGLGLYLCKVIVDAHGGAIRMESSGQGNGTTVTVELPMKPTTPVASARQETAAGA
ncbi:MAG: GAF domain-containing sensor histidine kinase [Thermoplasmatota archaeon]